MPRLFTAIEIPEDVAQMLTFLRGGLPGARWIDPENYHLTLRFIGDIDDAVANDVASILGQVNRAPFELRLEGLSSFGGKKPSPALMELQAEHERLMQRVGLAPESRKYTPHVTLARLRDTSARHVAEYLSERGSFRSAPFRVERVVLFSSRASVGGGPYVAEEVYPLQALQARRAI
jgi:2'-5' RNA ligase